MSRIIHCQKLGIDEESLSPEAMSVVEEALGQIENGLERIASTLTQVSVVTKTAAQV